MTRKQPPVVPSNAATVPSQVNRPDCRPGAELLQRLGVDTPPARLEEALTHASFVNEHPGTQHYEQLELLGDAVLALCATEILLEYAPQAGEGALTRMRAALVSTEALARFARTVDLGSYVRFGRGAIGCRSAEQSKVLADVLEALVAACYLDGGVEAARALTRTIVGDVARSSHNLAARDPKSKLQELMQHGGGSAPVYRTVKVHGPDHGRTFEVQVEVDGKVLGRGRGRTKKHAEQQAARIALRDRKMDGENTL